jgi:hypothetical protein
MGISTQSQNDLGPSLYSDIAIGYRFSDLLGAAVEYGHQGASAKKRYQDVTGSYSERLTTSVDEFCASFNVFPRVAGGFFVGVKAGVGFFEAADDFSYLNLADRSKNLDRIGSWDGRGQVLGAFFGYEHENSSGWTVWGRAGYQHCRAGDLQGEVWKPETGYLPSAPTNNAGQEITANFSGLHFLLGVGFRVDAPR